MKIVVATSPQFFIEENTIIQTLFEEGLDILHISKPGSEPIYCERLLTLMNPKWYGKVVVEDHFYLKEEYNLRGIHLTDRNPDIPENYKGLVSRTCTVDDIGQWADSCGHVVLDYSPSVVSQAESLHLINHKVYAGGVTTLEEVADVRNHGFGGIVLNDVLWSQFDHHESNNYKDLTDLFNKFRKATD